MSSTARIRRKLIEYSAQGSLKKIKALLKGAARESSASDSSEPSDSSGRSDSNTSSSASVSSESAERKRGRRRRKGGKEEASGKRGRSRKRSDSNDSDPNGSDSSSSRSRRRGSRRSSSSDSSDGSRRGKRRRKDEGKRRSEKRTKRRKHRDRASDSDSESDFDLNVQSESKLSADSDSGSSERGAAGRGKRRRQEEEAPGDGRQEKKRSKHGRSPSPRFSEYEQKGKRRDKREEKEREKREGKSSRRNGRYKKRRKAKSGHRERREKRPSSRNLLLDQLNSTDAQGWTPLHHAAHSGAADLVKYLLKIGNSNHNHLDKHHRKHLGKSSKDQKVSVSVSVQDSRGNTPVHVAARMGHASVIQLLRDAGADMQARNLAGETPEALVQRRLMDLRRRTAEAASERAGSVWGEGSDNEGYFGGGGGAGGYGNGSNNAALWGDPEENAEAAAAEARYHRFGSQSSRFGAGPWGADDAWRDDVAHEMKSRMRRDEESHRAAVFGAKREEEQDKRRRWEEERKVREEEARKVLEAEQAKDKAWRAAIKEQVQKKKTVQKQEQYDERWRRFAKSCDMGITMADVPFPVAAGQEDDLKHVVLHGVPREQHRKRMREEVVRWHPDKFMQKWGLRLHEKHRSSIERRVKELSQAVNNIYASLDK